MENFIKLISFLLHSTNQVHVFHLQTQSYSQHIALGTYYESIPGLIDTLVESYQGKYSILKGYPNYEYLEYENEEQVINYFEALIQSITRLRTGITESYIQNQIDNVEELIYSTLYKLKNLN